MKKTTAPISPTLISQAYSYQATQGQWGNVISLPVIPVGAATLPNGKLLLWSSSSKTGFTLGTSPQTWTSLFDPITDTATDTLIITTQHEMFCPGTSQLADGRILIAGGSNPDSTTIYDPISDTWSTGPLLNTPRAYQSNVTLPDNRVFTIGGSWNGGVGGKDGEIWADGSGWSPLYGAQVAPMIGPDPEGVFRGDNHAWLFTAPNGKVFQAGPSQQMNWYTTDGGGGVTSAGNRGDDTFSINGTAAMYDVGKILKTGGSVSYENGDPANGNTYVIDINSDDVSVRKVASLQYPRGFLNSVVLPNGQVLVVGGMPNPVTFSDDNAILVPELWDPNTETWTPMAGMQVPRTYHSVALLLPDGRVFSGGGGLCNDCSVNHFDAQIYSPPYLFYPDGTPASQPIIYTAPDTAYYGNTIQVTTDRYISNFSLIRFSSVTHTVNTDQRRIPLTFTPADNNTYYVSIPGSASVAPPGYYMLFAIDAQGVPSVSKIIRVN